MKKRMKGNDLNRRKFLNVSGTGTALLIGNALSSGTCFGANDDSSGTNSVTINTHEWYGDSEKRLDFPEDWEVKSVRMAGHNAPVLAPAEIRSRIHNPIGSKLLRDIAYGKKTAVITFDDLTHPTPVGVIAPYVIEELKAGGIHDENILFVGSYGNHRPMSQIEVCAKLGKDIVEHYPWINHNAWENVVDVGVTSFGNRIRLNYYFMQADVKVCISGLKNHGSAGYGGGGKAILPGVASIETVDFNHRTIAGVGSNRNNTVGSGRIFKNAVRLDMEEAAKLAGVDFTVQIVYNGKRRPVGVFAGECRQAHIEACRMANKHYVTEAAQNTDIVIANSYPQSRQGTSGLGWIRRSLKEGGSGVLIMENPMCLSSLHYLSERRSFNFQSYWDKLPDDDSSPIRGAEQFIILSQYLQQRDKIRFPHKSVRFVTTWAQVLELLKKQHRTDASVAIYPYAAIQHTPFELDSET